MPAYKKIYRTIDVESGKFVDPVSFDEMRSSSTLELFTATKVILCLTLVKTGGTAYNVAATDTFEGEVDLDFEHIQDTGALAAGYSGSVASMRVDGLTEVPPDVGTLRPVNSAGQGENVTYTSRTINGVGDYTFTVSKTLTYTYLENDLCVVEDPLMISSEASQFNISGDWSEVSFPGNKISARFDSFNTSFFAKIADSPELEGFIEIKHFPAGESIPSVILQDAVNLRNIIRMNEGNPPNETFAWLTPSQLDAVYQKKTESLTEIAEDIADDDIIPLYNTSTSTSVGAPMQDVYDYIYDKISGEIPAPGAEYKVKAASADPTGGYLDAKVDDSTIDINSNKLRVKPLGIGAASIADTAITAAKIHADVAGDGLAGGAGTALSVNVDGSTLEISTDALRVKALGITASQIAANAVTSAKILDANVTAAKLAAGLAMTKVNVESVLTEQIDTHWHSVENMRITNGIHTPITELDQDDNAKLITAQVSYLTATSDIALLLHLNDNFVDYGDNGLTVTDTAVTFAAAEGPLWGSARGVFNGTTSKLSVPSDADFAFGTDGPFLMLFRINADSGAWLNDMTFISRENAGGTSRQFRFGWTVADGLKFSWATVDGAAFDRHFTTYYAFDDETDYTVGVAYDGSKLSLFVVDGVVTHHVLSETRPVTINSGANAVLIGQSAETGNEKHFAGKIDEVLIVKGPISSYLAISSIAVTEGVVKVLSGETFVERKYDISSDVLPNIEAGTADGQMLYYDNSTSTWKVSDVSKLKWTVGTSTALIESISSTTVGATNLNTSKINTGVFGSLTIASGAVTKTKTPHSILGEGAAADDLATINGGSEGDLLILIPGNAAQNITLKHGTGNILTQDGFDYLIPDSGMTFLVFDGTNWRIVGGGGSDNYAIHDNVAGEIHAVTEKTTAADNDEYLMEDSADSYNKKRVKVSNAMPVTTKSGTFTSGDLSTGVLTITHNLGEQYGLVVNLVDDGGDPVQAPVTYSSTSALTVDLSSTTVSGTWRYKVIKAGGSATSENNKVLQKEKTGDHTLALADVGYLINMNTTSPTGNTVTIPLNATVAFEINSTIAIKMRGTGQTTIEAAAGVTLNDTDGGSCDIDARYKSCTLIKDGTDAWSVIGSVSTVSA